MSAEVHRLLVVDTTPGAHAEQAAVRVELLADVDVRCHEAGQTVTLQRGRFVVIEEGALQNGSGGGWS